jgi:disulfide bond formation protein DsbB
MSIPDTTGLARDSRSIAAKIGADSALLYAALGVALAALAGSLLLSLAMGLKACPLCFYQRTFVMGLVAVLGMGLVAGIGRAGQLSLLALPLATAGLGVALFHVSLEARGKLECPGGLFGLGTSPQQSLAAYLVLFVLLLTDVLRAPKLADGVSWSALVTAVVLGALLAVASCVANPPPPAPPKEPYAKPPDVCRPPFRPD